MAQMGAVDSSLVRRLLRSAAVKAAKVNAAVTSGG